MFETHYNEEMEIEVLRLEAKKRAADDAHPEWDNACIKWLECLFEPLRQSHR